MNYLSVENLSKHYGEKVLFENISFGLEKGDKVAIIANNGTGKTSLLKILAGKDISDNGRFVINPDINFGLLEQDPLFDDNLSVDELINNKNSKILNIIHNYENALIAQTNDFNDDTKRLFELASAEMDLNKAWDYERRMKQILTKFNITNLNQKIGSMSGGEKKRLAIAIVLLEEPEFLILDEPTNHLDIEMIEWLEKYLTQSSVTILMVTHDRYFLDGICNNILELCDGKLYSHKGNYSYFLEKREEREKVFETEINKAQRLMKKELEWLRRMPKARTTKSKSRIDAFYETKDKATIKKIKQELRLDIKVPRIGGKILELRNVKKQYDNKIILDGFDYIFKKGEKIGIVGKNGIGKSTLLNIITGKEKADSGSVITGETINYGYFSQEGLKIKEDIRVIDVVKDIAEIITLSDGTKLSASQFLQYFMFSPEIQYSYVSKLSGGERRRLHLLTVLITNPNFLILDEPTNDLDLLTLNKLEEFLLSFGGCLILVTHDRYFLDKLVDHIFIFNGNGNIKDYNGSYTEYKIQQEENEQKEKEVKTTIKKDDKSKTYSQEPLKRKLTYAEKLEYEKLDKEIAELEKEKSNIETSLNNSSDNYEEIQKLSNKIHEIISLIDEKTTRWMELAEFYI